MKAHIINLLIALLLVVLTSCKGSSNRNFNEGKIVYSVSYDSITTSKFNPKLLPSCLSIEFKDNNTKTTIEALSGAISFSLIKNEKQKQYSTLVKVVGKKLKHTEEFDTSHYPALYASVPKITIDSEVQDIEMNGYACKKVSGYFNNPTDRFDIIYTNDIQISNPNANTPFEAIDGVLIEFNLLLSPITLQIKACNIEKTKVQESTFEVPEEYVEVNYKTMTDIMLALQK